jgi:hypothetical protein
LPDPDNFGPAQETELAAVLKSVTGVDINFNVDGGAAGGNTAQESAARRGFVKWARENVVYLPTNEPEEFVWKRMVNDAKSKSIPADLGYKRRFEQLARLELGRNASETISSAEILQTQQRRLADMDVNLPELLALATAIDGFAAR